MRQSLNAPPRIRDTVMKYDNGPRAKVLYNQPPDVPHRNPHRIVRVRAPKHALVPPRPRKPQLPRPRHSTRRPKQLSPCGDADRSLGLFKIFDELRIGVQERGPVPEVMVADLMSGKSNPRNQLRMAQRALANKKKGRSGSVPLKNLKHFGRKLQMWAIIKRKRNQRTLRPYAINEVGGQSLQHAQDS